MKSSIGNAGSVSYIAVPRELSSIDTRAIVMSSGASTTEMKSQRPSVAHCALTFGPELLDLAVDLLDALRVVLHGLHALGGQRGEHEVRRHGASIGRSQGLVAQRLYPIARRTRIERRAHRLPSTHDAPRRHPDPRRRGRARRARRRPHAATLQTDTRCYQETQDVVVSGTGYAPMSTVSITRDGAPFGTAQRRRRRQLPGEVRRRRAARATSASASRRSAPPTARSTRPRRATARRRSSPTSPPTRATRRRSPCASASAASGSLRRHASVYLHYISPGGKLRRDVRLGTALGTCGVIRKTRERHLFPFPAERGRWILQFDTNKKYTRATSKSPYIWVRKPVEIFTQVGEPAAEPAVDFRRVVTRTGKPRRARARARRVASRPRRRARRARRPVHGRRRPRRRQDRARRRARRRGRRGGRARPVGPRLGRRRRARLLALAADHAPARGRARRQRDRSPRSAPRPARASPRAHARRRGRPPARDATRPPDPDPGESDAARFQLFDAVTSLLRAAAASGPLVLILDDLHGADQPSLLLLGFLAVHVRDSPILVIGTYRETEARLDPQLAGTLGDIIRHGQRLPLRGLRERDVARGRRARRRPPPARARRARDPRTRPRATRSSSTRSCAC